MSIIKIQKRDNPFVMVDKACVHDSRLSWRARGLLVYLLSMPPDWEVKVHDLVKRAPDGRDAIYSILKELRRIGYVKYEHPRSADGTLGDAHYYVFEVPEPLTENPEMALDEKLEPLPAYPEMASENIKTPYTDYQDTAIPDLVHPDLNKPDVYIINNIQNNELTNKAAAAANNQISNASDKSDTAITFTNQDVLITHRLTAYQEMRVDALAEHMITHVSYLTVSELAKQITETLISERYFTRCGNNFHRKLNAIQKTIATGGWTPPIESAERALHAKTQKLQQLKKSLSVAIADLTHWQNMQEFARSGGNQFEVVRIEKLIQEHKANVRTLQQQLQQQEEAATI